MAVDFVFLNKNDYLLCSWCYLDVMGMRTVSFMGENADLLTVT